jgi:hypothetical protein
MNYTSGAAFRRALEDRLHVLSLSDGTPLVRLRKMVAFDRFLARLLAGQPAGWLLKGGLALQLRLGARARTTKDMDLLLTAQLPEAAWHEWLVSSALLDLGDGFQFQVAASVSAHPVRFPVQSLLDGRAFETFHLDLATGDPCSSNPSTATTTARPANCMAIFLPRIASRTGLARRRSTRPPMPSRASSIRS